MDLATHLNTADASIRAFLNPDYLFDLKKSPNGLNFDVYLHPLNLIQDLIWAI
jgi:hypothetical protein